MEENIPWSHIDFQDNAQVTDAAPGIWGAIPPWTPWFFVENLQSLLAFSPVPLLNSIVVSILWKG